MPSPCFGEDRSDNTSLNDTTCAAPVRNGARSTRQTARCRLAAIGVEALMSAHSANRSPPAVIARDEFGGCRSLAFGFSYRALRQKRVMSAGRLRLTF